MQTVTKKAWNPDTGQEYEIEMPAPEVVRQAILKFNYPADGIRIRDAVDILAEKFELSNEQKAAVNKYGWNIFRYNIVIRQFQYLLKKEGKLVQPNGSKTPYFRAEDTPLLPSIEPVLNSDIGIIPEESIEDNYQQIRKELAVELLQKISENTPDFFEKLVVDLLVAMGYGGSREDAGKAVGRGGDGGIDGIINEDRLGLDVVYIQAKQWKENVSRPEIQKFAGALQGQRARKGIFITTSGFTKGAEEYVKTIDSKIILIDGNQVAQYMIEHNVGVSIEKTYEIKRVDSDYFAEDTENSYAFSQQERRK